MRLSHRSPHVNVHTFSNSSQVVSSEVYNDHWENGVYKCARCAHTLYEASAKFVGPCLWPSFRRGATPEDGALQTIKVPHGSYNKYTCEVRGHARMCRCTPVLMSVSPLCTCACNVHVYTHVHASARARVEHQRYDWTAGAFPFPTCCFLPP